jgi:hypothetical protein
MASLENPENWAVGRGSFKKTRDVRPGLQSAAENPGSVPVRHKTAGGRNRKRPAAGGARAAGRSCFHFPQHNSYQLGRWHEQR